MLKSRATWGCAVLVVAIALVTGPAFAFEFDLRGKYVWEYKYYSQLGTNGFFGPYNIAAVAPAAAYNGWLGDDITGRYLTSGSDAAATMMWMVLYPRFRVNKAISVQGSVYVGAYKPEDKVRVSEGGGGPHMEWDWNDDTFGDVRIPSYRREYFTGDWPGTQSNFAPVSFTNLWAKIQLPWGKFLFGKRPWLFGTGLMFDGEDNTSIEALTWIASYGPLNLGIIWYPWRRGNHQDYVQPFADMNGARDVDLGVFAIYNSGPICVGALTEYFQYDIGPEIYRWREVFGGQRAAEHVTVDYTGTLGSLFLKYFNGRFFLNSELAWYYETRRHRLNQADNDDPGSAENLWYTGSIFAPHYIEHYRAMIEAGAVAGPLKVTGLWAWVNGPDRRATSAVPPFRMGYFHKTGDLRGLPQYSNYSLFRPYSILLVGNYGMGNNSYTSPSWFDYRRMHAFQHIPGQRGRVRIPGSSHGYVTDANVYAARLDYAVAANLNCYASFLYADRVTHSYPRTFIRYSGYKGLLLYHEHPDWSWINEAPNIPDTSLGWEAGFGFDWKLLEGFTLSTAFAYWKPGNWFKYACFDRSLDSWNANWDNVDNPDRSIDPIFGTNIKMTVDF
jgi:hypothetical protein